MSDHDSFMRAIIDRPNDDVPRLVFADWLEENGEPDRAEFIRLQCEAAWLPAWEPRFDAIIERILELLSGSGGRWRDEVPAEWRPIFRRGMVEGLFLGQNEFEQSADELFRQIPLSEVRFTSLQRPVNLLGNENLYRLRAIGLAYLGIDLNIAERFLLGPIELGRLESLGLVALNLDGDVLRFIASLISLPSLRRLNLSDNPLGPGGLADIDMLLDGLEELNLSITEEDIPYSGRLRAMGIGELARSSRTANLRRLDLGGQLIGDAGLRHLAASTSLNQLEILDLRINDIGAIGSTALEELAVSRSFGQLRWLNLSRNPLRNLGLQELARWPGLGQLRKLDCSDCGITDAGVRALAAVEFHDDLRLNLEGNSISEAARATLVGRLGARVRF